MSDTHDELMFLNLDEAAEILEISKRSLVRMITQQKEVPASNFKQLTPIRQKLPLLEHCVERAFPLPSRERARVRGRCKPQSPSPHSSPVKGGEVRNLTVGEVGAQRAAPPTN